MKTKDYVTFEVAKMLEEKGFREPCNAVYFPAYKGAVSELHRYNNKVAAFFNLSKEYKGGLIDEYLAPSLYDAQKWLRDECGIDIEVTVYSQNRDYIVDVRRDTHLMILDEVIIKRSYEEALNEGIRESLKFIKDESK